jgi:hypothetical protein
MATVKVTVGKDVFIYRDQNNHAWMRGWDLEMPADMPCVVCGKEIRASQYYMYCGDIGTNAYKEFHIKCDPIHYTMCALAGD